MTRTIIHLGYYQTRFKVSRIWWFQLLRANFGADA